MGVNNRKRRAGRQRREARERQRSDGPGALHPPHAESWDGEMAFEVVEARTHVALRRLGKRRLADAEIAGVAEWLVASVAPHPRLVVEIVVADLLVGVVHAVAAGGWSPGDLAELARRNLGPAYVPTLAAALRHDSSQHPRGSAWQAAVDLLDPDPTLLLGAGGALPTSLGLAALLTHVPLLSDAVAATSTESGPEHPKLARVRALLAKAESTEFDEEAEALSAKAQELISRYALDRLVGEGAARDGNAPHVRRLWLDAPYVRAKASLVAAVASANRCRSATADRWGFCVVVGGAADLDAVELLATSLMVQADAAMLRHGRRPGRAGTTRTRSFRQSFLTAYATRIGERLAAASVAAARASGADLLPVLRSQEVEGVRGVRSARAAHRRQVHEGQQRRGLGRRSGGCRPRCARRQRATRGSWVNRSRYAARSSRLLDQRRGCGYSTTEERSTTRSAESRCAVTSWAFGSSTSSTQARASSGDLPNCSCRRASRSRRTTSSTSTNHTSAQQRTYALPAAVGEQEVVALGDDQPRGGWDRDRASDGLFEVALEARDEERPVRLRMQPLERRDVAVDVEGVGRSLAVSAPQSLELDVGQVEAVHRQMGDGVRPERVRQAGEQQVGEGRLPGTRRAGDAEHDSTAADHPRVPTPARRSTAKDLMRRA